MSDYVLHNREQFKDSTVLELGAGVGMVSIVACLTGAKYVLCTGLCQDKIKINVSMHTLQCTCTMSQSYMYIPPPPPPPTLAHTHTFALKILEVKYWISLREMSIVTCKI